MAVELKAIAKLDGKPFERNVKKMGNSVDKFKTNQLAGLKNAIAGAFAIGGLIQFGRKLLKTADDLQTAANIFGTTIETMIAFQNVMAESGIGAERFNKIFARIAGAQVDVKNGLKTYIDALKEMNITADEFKSLKVDEVLELMASKYAEIGDKQQFVGGMTKLLGARTVDLIEVFQRMNRGMGSFRAEAEGAAEGMRELAKASDLFEKIGNKLITSQAKNIGLLAEGWRLAKVAAIDYYEKITGKQGWKGVVSAIFTGGASSLGSKAVKEAFIKGPETSPTATAPGGAAAGPGRDPATERKAADAQTKLANAATRADEKRHKKEDDFNRAQDKLATDFSKKSADIQSGKGISAPSMARVDPLQAIGGLIGGVAGKGDQAARIAERQTKTQEAMERLMIESNRKLEELNLKMDGIID